LQLSPNASYGDAWASLDLDSFCQAISQDNAATDPISLVKSSNSAWMSSNIDLGSSHHYNIDLSPKVVMCAGKLIELLIGSGSHNYTEFKHIHSSYIKIKDQLIKVPSSKSEIFKDRFLELPQKRALMKFMTACTTMMMTMEEEEEEESDSRSMIEFMKDHGCDAVLQSLVLHGVLLTETSYNNSSSRVPSVKQGLEMLKTHSLSVGRYGPGTGAYLSPMYGCGEIPQALCRSAAVAGAVQALRCPIKTRCCGNNEEGDDDDDNDEYQWTLNVDNGGEQELRCKAFFDGSSVNKSSSSTLTMIRRCTAILDGPVIAGEAQSIIIIPSTSNGGEHASVVWGVSLTHGTAVCPKGKALLYLWASGNTNNNDSSSSNKSLLEALDTLADTSHLVDYRRSGGDDRNEGEIVKSKVLLAMCYTQPQQREEDGQFSLPDASPTFEDAIDAAKQAYSQLYPPPTEGKTHFPLDLVPDRSTNEGSGEDEELALLEEILSKSAVQ